MLGEELDDVLGEELADADEDSDCRDDGELPDELADRLPELDDVLELPAVRRSLFPPEPLRTRA